MENNFKAVIKMCASKFLFLDKQKLDEYLPELFEILYTNMNSIVPTGNAYDEDFSLWKPGIISEMQKNERKIVLMYVDGMLAGYFRYCVYSDTASLVMEDIQIKALYRGKYNIFRTLYGFVLEHINDDIHFVEAYANKINKKS